MEIETDEEFVALMRARFASKPYSNSWPSHMRVDEYWTDERYEALIADLLETQRTIRSAAIKPPDRPDSLSSDDWDVALLKWAIWSIQTHDVGATPTHWHRVWSAVQSAITMTRFDERRRIAADLRRDQAEAVGKTAASLIESAIASEVECD